MTPPGRGKERLRRRGSGAALGAVKIHRQFVADEKGVELVIGQGVIGEPWGLVAFVFGGDAGADVDDGGVGAEAAAQQLGLGLHGGEHRSQQRHQRGEVPLDEQYHRGAAGREDHIPVSLGHQVLVLGFDQAGALCRFKGIGKAQGHQLAAQRPEFIGTVLEGKGGRHHGVYRLFRLEQLAHRLDIPPGLVGILRAGQHTPAAEDAVLINDLGMMIPHGDGFHRTPTDAFIAVLAVGFLKAQNIHGPILSAHTGGRCRRRFRW